MAERERALAEQDCRMADRHDGNEPVHRRAAIIHEEAAALHDRVADMFDERRRGRTTREQFA